jgi:Protein of unknown function (DUF2490)
LSSRLEVTWTTPLRLSEELPNPAHYVFGTDWNFSVGENLVLTPSYYYGTYHTPSGATGHRQAPILAVTPKFSRGSWTISDRNRFGGRIDTPTAEPSWFYRDRPRVDSNICPSRLVSSLFVGDEIFYFSKYKGWTRNRFAAGGGARNSVNVLQSIFSTKAKTAMPAAGRPCQHYRRIEWRLP